MIFSVEERAPLPLARLNQIVCPSAKWKAGRQHVIDAGVIRELQEPRTKIHRDAAHVDEAGGLAPLAYGAIADHSNGAAGRNNETGTPRRTRLDVGKPAIAMAARNPLAAKLATEPGFNAA